MPTPITAIAPRIGRMMGSTVPMESMMSDAIVVKLVESAVTIGLLAA